MTKLEEYYIIQFSVVKDCQAFYCACLCLGINNAIYPMFECLRYQDKAPMTIKPSHKLRTHTANSSRTELRLFRNLTVYITTHQHDSSQPQQSHSSPQDKGLGLTMEVTEEMAEPGMLILSLPNKEVNRGM